MKDEELTNKQRKVITEAVRRVLLEYGETLHLLAKE